MKAFDDYICGTLLVKEVFNVLTGAALAKCDLRTLIIVAYGIGCGQKFVDWVQYHREQPTDLVKLMAAIK
jgi:hypothetical protein